MNRWDERMFEQEATLFRFMFGYVSKLVGDMSDEEFDSTLATSIDRIYDASVAKADA